MTKITIANPQMRKTAEYAVKVASKNFGQSLDYTENSLIRFESLLQQAYERTISQASGKKIPEEAIKRTAGVWGSYLGELMRRKWGGKWIKSETDVSLVIKGKTFYPLQQVFQRITLGKRYSIEQYIADVASDLKPPPKKSAGDSLIKTFSDFWKSSSTAKIVSVVALLVVLGGCCLSLVLIIPKLHGSTSTAVTPTLIDISLQAPASATIPPSRNTLAPTASFIPSIIPTSTIAPSLTATAILTETPTLTPTLTYPPTGTLIVTVSVPLEIISITSPVDAGAYATLIAKTSPNASCNITVYSQAGPSQASGLGHKPADAIGMVSWIWKVGSNTTPGTWPIDVTCEGVTQSTTFTVR